MKTMKNLRHNSRFLAKKIGPIPSRIKMRYATTTRIYYFLIHAARGSTMIVKKIGLDVLKDLHDFCAPEYESVFLECHLYVSMYV
jgi:hypothetical protein